MSCPICAKNLFIIRGKLDTFRKALPISQHVSIIQKLETYQESDS
ncbi:5653_t:CDS:2 [Dentiscutata erythropus]|uniref:5653_t:CDS:1 n=1 Tax=Dentiscutata erythropus TaxID=1348616 RepID=A0A9N9C4W9_9GLOM|nr:5653_t:CDS:2 [Dentiscutata erythropus]